MHPIRFERAFDQVIDVGKTSGSGNVADAHQDLPIKWEHLAENPTESQREREREKKK